MRIAGYADSDDHRPAAEVRRERGVGGPWPNPDETWGSYALRTGIARRETAKRWWHLNEAIDAVRGLEAEPQPLWHSTELDTWDRAAWLEVEQHKALRTGQRIYGPLDTRLGAWERTPPDLQREFGAPRAGASVDWLISRADHISEAVETITGAASLSGGGGVAVGFKARLAPSTVQKLLRKGGELAWDGAKFVLRTSVKAIPIVKFADTVYTVAQIIDWLSPTVHAKYLPVREFQFASKTWIYRWPNGDVTNAPAPSSWP